MADKVLPGPVENENMQRRGPLGIHTMEITDACREKDLIENLRMYPCVSSQPLIEAAITLHQKSAEIINAEINVEALGFKEGFFRLDIRLYYRILAENRQGGAQIKGLAVFDKTVILFGGESKVKTFMSDENGTHCYTKKPMPTAVLNTLEPIILNMRISETPLESDSLSPLCIPESIITAMGESIALTGKGKRIYVSLGQFSTIRLERDALLDLNEARYFSPKEQNLCLGEDDPCAMFEKMNFPADEF